MSIEQLTLATAALALLVAIATTVVPKAISALCFFLSYCITHPVADGLLLLGLTWGIALPPGYVLWRLRR